MHKRQGSVLCPETNLPDIEPTPVSSNSSSGAFFSFYSTMMLSSSKVTVSPVCICERISADTVRIGISLP